MWVFTLHGKIFSYLLSLSLSIFIDLSFIIYPPVFCERDRRLARAFHRSACSWWIYTVQLTLWKWCPLTPSERGNTSYLFLKCKCNLSREKTPRGHPPKTVQSPFTSSLPSAPPYYPCLIFCMASSETATSPWWLGSAALASRSVGWIASRTSQCCVCARRPRGPAQRQVVGRDSTLAICTVCCFTQSEQNPRFHFPQAP